MENVPGQGTGRKAQTAVAIQARHADSFSKGMMVGSENDRF